MVLARTSQVTTCWRYDAAGRTEAIEQSLNGVTLRVELGYDDAGRLATMRLPGGDGELRYTWDDRGRPLAVTLPGSPTPGGATSRRYPTSRKYSQLQKVTCRLPPGDGAV